MIGAHFQTPINDWPRAIVAYPDGVWHKSVQDQHLMRDIKAHTNGKAMTVFRWPVPNDHYDPYLNRPNKEGAREFFSHFVDGTFLELAVGGAFDAVETFNEVYGNGQDSDSRTAFINFELDAVDVWIELQAANPELRSIKLCLANTAIGNDIPDEIAQAAHIHGHYMGYHSYVPTLNKEILAGEWLFYSGRFEAMDNRWRAKGWFVNWLGTEGGPVGYTVGANGEIHLQGGQGWRYPSVCDHDMFAYEEVLRYWLNRTAAWNEAHGNRHRGMVLFTTSVISDQWGYFQHTTSELESLGLFMSAWGPIVPPIEPPPTPTIRKYSRTVHLLPQNATHEQAVNVLGVAFDNKQSVVWSADDAVMNPDQLQAELTGKNVIVWGDAPGGTIAGWEQWVRDHYPPYPDTMTYRSFVEFEAFRFTFWPTEFRTGGVIEDGPYGNQGLNQMFGANPDIYAQYGLPGHDGLDLRTITGSPISAAADGIVYRVETDPTVSNYGIHVRIRHADGYKSIYAHLSTANVLEGDVALGGMVIGYGGSTGNSTGPHLHLGLKLEGSTANGSGWPYDIIDPWPYMGDL